jgi:hypothetical protein
MFNLMWWSRDFLTEERSTGVQSLYLPVAALG